jgi:predicted RecB family nuclease
MSINFYTPSRLKDYLNCKHKIFLEANKNKLGLKKKDKNISDLKRLEKGNLHEDEYYKLLKNKYLKVIDIKKLNISSEEKYQKTIESMKVGFDIIRGGYLKDDKWSGEFDFLQKSEKYKSNLGEYSYEVIDTKNTSGVKTDHIIQVGMYSYLLEKIQGLTPQSFFILLKDLKKEEIKVSQVNEFFLENKIQYEHFIKNDLNKTKPEKCDHCKICDWQEVCENDWKTKRHLNQVGGNNKNYIKKFNKNNINTIDDLAKIDVKKKIENLKEEVLQKLKKQAELQLTYEKTGKPCLEIIAKNISEPKGFNLLPKPSSVDLFFDLESVPDHIYSGKLEYLFGIYYVEDDKEIYIPFWAHSKDEEKNSLKRFFKLTKDHFKKYPDAKIYHYASYEITALEKLTSFHKVHGIDYDHYLHMGKFVDLFRVTKQAILVSENSYSIKNLEKFYNFERKGDVQKGDKSEQYYIEWMETKNQKLLDELQSYNLQDCKSTYELRNWLLSIKPNNTKWLTPSKEIIELRDKEIKFLDYQEKLEKTKVKDKELINILKDIHGFYNRENKPDWREYFDRKYFSHTELIDDIECIGNMKKVGDVTQEKRSYVFKYAFEEQEFKLKEGKRATIANNLFPDQTDDAGTIVELNHEKKYIKLKRGTKAGHLPDQLSIGPGSPFDPSKLELSTYNFIDSVLDQTGEFQSLRRLLQKENPKIKGIKKGEKILKTNNFFEEIPNIISNLDNSYIYLQGPPGTGKSTQAANAIVELIKKNKKVAITANSHKVIHNLIEKVEITATEKKVNFKGLKAGRTNDVDTIYNGKFVVTSSRDTDFIYGVKDKTTLLFAGTKYHLSNGYYDSKIDYLFIDEAGQISVADLIVLGQIAKNIVLIGDQNQLGQPTKGSHPGLSGKSILEFLLDGQDTIPEDKGIFLNKTYRLHPKINEFTSSSFYENRLITDAQTKNRKILTKDKSFFPESGIYYLDMDHEDNIQTSQEECDEIKKIVDSFIGLDYFDGKKNRKITIKDILIISPYNAQVNLIGFNLKNKEARVGTIDKFQGQEAPITIISMTSSDPENLPRNKEFFFSRNRLNVAISRAQCISIILFNSNLLNFVPKTVDQVKLINNFYKIKKKYKIN